MFSKRLKLIASLVLLLFLVACGGSDDDDGGVFGAGGTGNGTGSESAGPGDTTDEVAQRSLAIGSGEGDSFQEAVIGASTTSLSTRGSTQLYFNIIDRDNGNNLMTGEAQAIEVISRCLGEDLAEIMPETLTTTDGSVEFTYNATGCSGVDVVTARLANGGSATVELTISATGGIAILSGPPEPLSIYPSAGGTTDRPNFSVVPFTVVDSENNTVEPSNAVQFRLFPPSDLSNSGDPKLESTEDTTATGGRYEAVVIAGSGNRIVRVVASVEIGGEVLETTSAPIAINSGVHHEDLFEIALDNYAPNAWAYNGEIVTVTAYAADSDGVNIRDGLISFTTTGGSIEGDCRLDATGVCSVAWRSQIRRPAGGVVEITAQTIGTTCTTDGCDSDPEVIKSTSPLLMASDKDIQLNWQVTGNKYCVTASAGPGATRIALPSDTTFAFSFEADEVATGEEEGEITSEPTTFSVANTFTDSGISGPYCVDVTGPGELKVVVTPSGRYSGSGEHFSRYVP